MSLSDVKQNLISIISSIDDVTCTFDYATAVESQKAVVIDSLDISYEHDLDMGYHKTLRVVAVLVTKTDSDLDELIDELENLDDATDGCIRDIMLESVNVSSNDENVRVATVNLSCLLWDI